MLDANKAVFVLVAVVVVLVERQAVDVLDY
jgi:hypothetical protein